LLFFNNEVILCPPIFTAGGPFGTPSEGVRISGLVSLYKGQATDCQPS
jgi:hypothetical protein